MGCHTAQFVRGIPFKARHPPETISTQSHIQPMSSSTMSMKRQKPNLTITIPKPGSQRGYLQQFLQQKSAHSQKVNNITEPLRSRLAQTMAQLTLKWWYPIQPTDMAQTFQNLTRFVHVLLRHLPLSTYSVMLALYYIHQLTQFMPNKVMPNAGSEMRIVIVALMIADTQAHSKRIPIDVWAELTGLASDALLKMRIEFLNCIQYKIEVNAQEYVQWIQFVAASTWQA